MAFVGEGTTLDFATSEIEASVDFDSINWNGVSVAAIDAGHLALSDAGAGKFGNVPFLPGKLVDPGTLECDAHFSQTKLPSIGVAETIELAFPAQTGYSAGLKLSGTGFVQNYSIGVVKGDKVTLSLSIKWSGNITVTAPVAS